MQTVLGVGCIGQHLHQYIAVGYQADYYADILGKRYQQLTEVLIGYGVMLGVEFLDAAHALDKLSRILAELLLELLRSNESLLYHGVKQGSKQGCLLKPGLLNNHNTGPDTPFQSRNSVLVSPVSPLGNTFAEQSLKPAPILSLKQRPGRRHQLPV